MVRHKKKKKKDYKEQLGHPHAICNVISSDLPRRDIRKSE